MKRRQFRVLYREFLFRLVDRDVLAAGAQGDASRLLGRLATILVVLSIPFAFMAASIDTHQSREAVVTSAWTLEHSLVATTMLLVGVFSVLSWDSAYPDRRDVLVLAPLPVRPSTIFFAKLASIAAATGATVILFNAADGLMLPFALAPSTATPLDLLLSLSFYQRIAAYWITVFAAGAFVLLCLLAIQGIAGQLPRRIHLQVSALLQMAVFVTLVGGFFLQPAIATGQELLAPRNQNWLAWCPSYWFAALFQEMSGLLIAGIAPQLTALANRALAGLSAAAIAAGAAFVLSYFRTLRKIAEQPDIVSRARRRIALPPMGNSLVTAICHFAIRTVMRSRQHRMLLSFYAGMGFGVVILFAKIPVAQMLSKAAAHEPWRQVSLPLLASSFVMLCFWLVGTRIVFGIPLELKANWIFRTTQIRATEQYREASRRAAYLLGIAPVWLGCAALFLRSWPWHLAIQHLVVLGLAGVVLTELSLRSIAKIPFTCSYLPGTSHVHITFVLCLMLGLNIIFWSADFERHAFFRPGHYAGMIAVLLAAAVCLRWKAHAKIDGAELRFEEREHAIIDSLGLHRDGVMLVK